MSRRLRIARRCNGKTQPFRCVRQAVVVGEEGAEVVAQAESGGEVDGVEAAQAGGLEGGGLVKQGVVEREKGDLKQPFAGILCVLAAMASAGPYRLDAK